MKKPIPPDHLTAAARDWWLALVADYAITDRAGLLLLTQAAEAWDRARECREAIKRDGVTYTDKAGQPKPHPLLSVERDCRAGFLAAMKHLHIDVEVKGDPRA